MMHTLLFTQAFLACLLLKPAVSVDCGVTQKTTYGELKRQLLCNYDRSMRPVMDINAGVIITLRMHLKSFYYDENMNRLTLYTWLSMAWIDEHLKWDPSKFENINELLVSSQEIWTPDISLYNSDNGQSVAAHGDVNCEIRPTGKLACVLPIEFTAHCTPNYQRWPYDTQNCTLFFGSWMSPGEHIDYNNKTLGIITKEVQPNVDWKITNSNVRRISKAYSCCPNQTFPTLEFSFTMERHSGSIEVVSIIPGFILLVMNLLVFLMNHEKSQRLMVCAVSLISHFLFVQHLAWLIPRNGDSAPSLLLFYRDSMLISLAVLLETIVVQALNSCTILTPSWIDGTVKAVSQNSVANLVFFHIPYQRKGDEETADDSILVQTKQVPTIWKLFGTFLDRLCFLLFLVCYLIMYIALLPGGY